LKEDELGTACNTLGEKRDSILVGKPQKKRQLEIPRLGWEDNIKTDLREMRWVVWTGFV
jgi:hypothetical protein